MPVLTLAPTHERLAVCCALYRVLFLVMLVAVHTGCGHRPPRRRRTASHHASSGSTAESHHASSDCIAEYGHTRSQSTTNDAQQCIVLPSASARAIASGEAQPTARLTEASDVSRLQHEPDRASGSNDAVWRRHAALCRAACSMVRTSQIRL